MHARSLRLSSALLALALSSACASAPVAGPAVDVERAPWIRTAHARIVDDGGAAHLEVDLRAAFPGLESRRSVTVQGYSADGQLVFTRAGVAEAGMQDARYHRNVDARLALPLPDLSGVAELRVIAGR